MAARNGPGNDDRRLHEGERRIGERLAGLAQDDTAPRRPEAPCAFDYLRREHAVRERQLRLALADAVRRQHVADQRLVLAWLDDLYTSRAFLRSEDREVKRYRRLLREAA